MAGYDIADYIEFFNKYVLAGAQMLTGFYFFTRFLDKKVRRIYYLLVEVLCIVIIRFVQGGGTAEFLAYVLLLILCGIFVCHADMGPVILYATLIVGIIQLSHGITNSLLSIFYPFFLQTQIAAIVYMILGNLSLLVAVSGYYLIYQYFSNCQAVRKQYVLMILTPILMIFLMDAYITSVVYGNLTDNGGVIVYANHYKMLVIQLLGMASLFCVMFAYKKLLENFRLNTELSLLEQEEHSLNQYVEEAKTHYEKTKSFRHDIRNHISVVKELLQNGKSEQALNYIGDMEGMTEELSFPCSTNNPVVDILVGNKLGIAKSTGIDVSCFLRLPYPCFVRDIDFCIILSNALDNAIHACKNMDSDAEKYIRVTGHVQGDFILLEIENSYQGKCPLKRGTGLSNVKAVAEKYHGAMNIKTQDTSFVLSVLLILVP